MTHTKNHESQSATDGIHLPQYPLNGTQLECDGSELRLDGTCAKCERINERIASHFATPPDVTERARRATRRIINGLPYSVAQHVNRGLLVDIIVDEITK